MSPRLLSGIKPTGSIHIGNYFGAMKQFVDLQNEYESFIFIADLHALNQIQDAKELHRLSQEIASAYLAIGLDPNKVTLFRQSEVPEHSELALIFGAISSMGMLERAHAYKDAVAKNKSVNVGLFTYPILMAADILLYKPSVVPVGHDQQQHVEIATDIAERFNHLYGATFTPPKPLILEENKIVPGLDGRKMSKSYDNVIGLFDEPEVILKKVAKIVTDSSGPTDPKNPETCNVFALHKLVATEGELEELRQAYQQGVISYKESKDLLGERLNRFLTPIRAKKSELDANPDQVRRALGEGRERASKVAKENMQEIRNKIGLGAI